MSLGEKLETKRFALLAMKQTRILTFDTSSCVIESDSPETTMVQRIKGKASSRMIELSKHLPGRALVVSSLDARGQKRSTSGDDGALTGEARHV